MKPELLDLAGLAEFLHVSKHTAARLAKRFPSFDLGDRTRRFDPEEIINFLRDERSRKEQHAAITDGLHVVKRNVG